MNNRQKAKRFKKLYEDCLKKPIKPIIYPSWSDLNHCEISAVVDMHLAISANPYDYINCAKEMLARQILNEMKPIVINNMVISDSIEFCGKKGEFHFWVPSKIPLE